MKMILCRTGFIAVSNPAACRLCNSARARAYTNADGSRYYTISCRRLDCDNHVHQRGGDSVGMERNEHTTGNLRQSRATTIRMGDGGGVRPGVRRTDVAGSGARQHRTKTEAAKLLEAIGVRLIAWMLWLATLTAEATGLKRR